MALPGRDTDPLRPIPALLILVTYVATCLNGTGLPLQDPPAALLWAPTGIALGAHIRYGPRVWPILLLATWLGLHQLSWLSLLINGIITLAGPLLAAMAWRRWASRRSRRQNDLRDVIYFVLLVAASMMLSASLATTLAERIADQTSIDEAERWITWWISTTNGALVFAPLVLYAHHLELIQRWRRRWAEGLAIILLFMATIALLLLLPAKVRAELPLLLFLLFPLILWPALRFGLFEAAAMLAAFSLLATIGTAHALGPFGFIDSHLAQEYLWVFVSGSALSVLTVALLTEANRFSRQQTESARDMLATIFDHISEGALVLNPQGAVILHNQRLCDLWRVSDEAFRDRRHSPNAVANLLIDQLQEPTRYRAAPGSLLPLRRDDRLQGEIDLVLKDRRTLRQSVRYCCTDEIRGPHNTLLIYEDVSREREEVEHLRRNSRLSEFSAHFAGAIARADFHHFTDTLDHCLGLLGRYLESDHLILIEVRGQDCHLLQLWVAAAGDRPDRRQDATSLCSHLSNSPVMLDTLQRGRRWRGHLPLQADGTGPTATMQLRPLIGDAGQLIAVLALPDPAPDGVVTAAILTLATENLAGMLLRQRTYQALEQARSALERKNHTLKALSQRLRILAGTDQLTGLANRHTLDHEMQRLLEQARRYDTHFSVILLDIDFFKQINDRHGHQLGDQVLVWVGRNLRKQARESDLVCRWGGEEFLLLCPLTELGEARALAERIRQTVAAQTFPTVGTVTISLGVAAYQPGDSAQDLVQRADRALYRAKHHGRNQVVIAQPATG